MWNFYACVFRARFKTSVTPSFWVAFFLLAALVLALGLLFNRADGLAIRVGFMVNDDATDGSVSARVLRSVVYYGQKNCEMVPYTDEAQLKQDVSAHKLECGYVLTDGKINAYRSQSAVSAQVLDLLVAAAYLETMAGELGEAVLSPYAEEMDDAAANMSADIQARADAYLKNGALMEIRLPKKGFSARDLKATQPPAPYRRLFHGVTGLSGLLLALLCAMGLAGSTEAPVLDRLRSAGRGGAGYTLAGIGVVFVAVLLFMGLTVTAGSLFYPGLDTGWQPEALLIVAYALSLAGLVSLLSVCVRANAFPALISFIFVFAALLGGTFFDLREVLASAAFLRFFFPNYYFLDGVSQTALSLPWPQAVVLAGAGLAAGALAVKISHS